MRSPDPHLFYCVDNLEEICAIVAYCQWIEAYGNFLIDIYMNTACSVLPARIV